MASVSAINNSFDRRPSEINSAWTLIEGEFNALGETPRTVKQLKYKFENMKRLAKKVNSAEENELSKIKQLLMKNEEPKPTQIKHERKEINRLTGFEGKSVFVKRVIPHGYTTGEFEYDPKLNTIYTPLFRLHVKKPIEDHERSILKEMVSIQLSKGNRDKSLVVIVNGGKNQQDMEQKRKRKKKKKRFQSLLSRLKKEAILRGKSGEQHDPLAPGKLPDYLADQEATSSESVEKVIQPHYPFWNYWTYQKGIIQDECPGHLIKVHNMCISSIGHRKFLEALLNENLRRSNSNKDRSKKPKKLKPPKKAGGKKKN